MFKVKMRMEIYEEIFYEPIYEKIEIVGKAQTYKGAREIIELLEKEMKKNIEKEN